MEYAKLGNSELLVSRFCVGCMSFGDPASKMHAWTLDPDQSEAIIAHALELGINFFDTANTYSAGTSEEYLARALKKHVRRDQVVLATKVYFNEGHLSKAAILREIDGSLRRLGTDYIDLYQMHWPSREPDLTPICETMAFLLKLKEQGKIRAKGMGGGSCTSPRGGRVTRATRARPLAAKRTATERAPTAMSGV